MSGAPLPVAKTRWLDQSRCIHLRCLLPADHTLVSFLVCGKAAQEREPLTGDRSLRRQRLIAALRDKEEGLASVEVEANEPCVLSTMWSAAESSPGHTRKPWIVRSGQFSQ